MICLFLSIVVAFVSSRYCCCPLDGFSTSGLEDPIHDRMDDDREYEYGYDYGYGHSYEDSEGPVIVTMPSSCIPTDAVIVTVAPATAAVADQSGNDASVIISHVSIAEPVNAATDNGSRCHNVAVVTAVPM